MDGIEVVENKLISEKMMWDPLNPSRLLVRDLEEFKAELAAEAVSQGVIVTPSGSIRFFSGSRRSGKMDRIRLKIEAL